MKINAINGFLELPYATKSTPTRKCLNALLNALNKWPDPCPVTIS